MTAYFSDLFNGTGDLSSHTPDLAISGFSWSDPDFPNKLTLSGGLASPGGAYTAGGSYTGAIVPAIDAISVSWEFVTGSDVTATASRLGFQNVFGINDYGVEAYLVVMSGVWKLVFFGGPATTVTLAPDTTYSGVMTANGSDVSLTMFGVTLTEVCGDFSPTVRGLTDITVALGDGFKFASVAADSPASAGTAAIATVLASVTSAITATGAPPAPPGTMQVTAEVPSIGSALTASEGVNRVASQLPLLAASIRCGNIVRGLLPMMTSAMAVEVTSLAKVVCGLPSVTAALEGDVPDIMSVSASLGVMNVAGYGGSIISATVGGITALASGKSGIVGGVRASLPLVNAEVTVSLKGKLTVGLSLPPLRSISGWSIGVSLPRLTAVVVGVATVTATYEAYALNLNHKPVPGKEPTDEMTRYTNFPFTHVVRYQNSYFGANSTGLYLLEGTTDDGTPIEWDIQTATTDFGTPQLKTVEMAFFGGRFGPAAEITLFAGETASDPYVYTTPRDTTAKNYRQTFGRGLKARYYALAAKGADELVLDSITLNIANLARRI